MLQIIRMNKYKIFISILKSILREAYIESAHKGYVEYDVWKEIGRTKQLVFNETYKEYIGKN